MRTKTLFFCITIITTLFSTQISHAKDREAVFAGGCFWCLEKPFDVIDGVKSTTSGYIGGAENTANYSDVSSGSTKHREAIRIVYDESKVSYETLLGTFWKNIDPLDSKGQFCDKGYQYTSAVYYSDDVEKKMAEKSKALIKEKFGKPVATAVEAKGTFYPAEDYHQDYYQKKPFKYSFYRNACGRDKRLKKLWK